MSVSSIRTDIVTKLTPVPGVENVKDFIIWSDDWRDIVNRFSADGRMHTWMVGLANSNRNIFKAGALQRFYLWNVVAYYSIKTVNKSSQVFENLIEAVMNEFSKSISFISTAGSSRPMNLVKLENTVFQNTPAHRAILEIDIDENIDQDAICSG